MRFDKMEKLPKVKSPKIFSRFNVESSEGLGVNKKGWLRIKAPQKYKNEYFIHFTKSYRNCSDDIFSWWEEKIYLFQVYPSELEIVKIDQVEAERHQPGTLAICENGDPWICGSEAMILIRIKDKKKLPPPDPVQLKLSTDPIPVEELEKEQEQEKAEQAPEEKQKELF